MATQVDELYLKNKNRSKRDASAGGFSMQIEIPGGATLGDGDHILGKLEGNVCITRVSLVVRNGFDGTVPTLTVADNNGNTYFTTEDISTQVVVESDLTANAAVRPDPIYAELGTIFTGTLVGGSAAGELMLVVDYTQLDTVTGLHTR